MIGVQCQHTCKLIPTCVKACISSITRTPLCVHTHRHCIGVTGLPLTCRAPFRRLRPLHQAQIANQKVTIRSVQYLASPQRLEIEPPRGSGLSWWRQLALVLGLRDVHETLHHKSSYNFMERIKNKSCPFESARRRGAMYGYREVWVVTK